jgi:hypothetical protein
MFSVESIEIQNWMTILKSRAEDYHNQYQFVNCPEFEVQEAKKYVKVWSLNENGLRSSIIAFINRENGDIFKPAGTKAPAKHARGNITSEQCGEEAFGHGYSIRYL